MNKRREEHYRQERYKQENYKTMQLQNTNIDALRNEYDKKIADKNLIINELLKKVKTLTIELADYKLGKNI
jgi:hypothetical protein